MLTADDNVETADDAGVRWLDDLATPRLPHRDCRWRCAVAGRTRASAAGDGDGEPAEVRVRARSGRWAVVRGSTLGAAPQSGTTSRGDLVARLFFDHYRPRLTTSRAVD